MKKDILKYIGFLFIIVVLLTACGKKEEEDEEEETPKGSSTVVNKIDDNYDKNHLFKLEFDYDNLGTVKIASINGKKDDVKVETDSYNNVGIYYSNNKIYYYNKDKYVHTYDIVSKKDDKLDLNVSTNIDIMNGNDKYIYYYTDKASYIYDISKKNSKKIDIKINVDKFDVYIYDNYLVYKNDDGISVYNIKTDKNKSIIDKKEYGIDNTRSFNNILVYYDGSNKDTNYYYYELKSNTSSKIDKKKIDNKYLNSYNTKEYYLNDEKVLIDNKDEYMKFDNSNVKAVYRTINSYIYVIRETALDRTNCKDKTNCAIKVKSESYYLLNLQTKKYDKLF